MSSRAKDVTFFDEIIEVFDNNQTGYLLISDSLDSAPQKLSFTEVEKKFGFKYKENILIPKSLVNTMQVSNVSPGHGEEVYRKMVLDRLKRPLNDSLAIRFIDREVGYGLFATKTIDVGTIVGIYSGQCERTTGIIDYGMDIAGSGFRINGERIGGVARFIQHMPYRFAEISKAIKTKANTLDNLVKALRGNGSIMEESDFKRLTSAFLMAPDEASKALLLKANADENIKSIAELAKESKYEEEISSKTFLKKISNLATANLISANIIYKGQRVVFLVACSDITPGEQLGMSYGLSYWNIRHQSPRYFDKQGHLIPLEAYLPKLDTLLSKYKLAEESSLPSKELALRRCSAIGNEDDVLFLLEYGVNINDQNSSSKKTAVHRAAENKQKDIVNLLLLRGGNPLLTDVHGKKAIEDINWQVDYTLHQPIL